MEGAGLRRQERMGEVWFTAMLPRLKDPPTLEKFTGVVPDKRAAIHKFVAAWDKIDRGLAASKKRTRKKA